MRARLGLDRFDLGVLAALAGLSMLVLAALATKGRPLSGADGLLPADQLQYFSWIREAAEHGLIGNRYDLVPGDRAFFHPGFLLTGVVHQVLGISIPLAYLLWKPVAVALTFFAARRYVRRLVDGLWERRVALVLVIFSVAPAAWIVAWSNWGGNPRQFTFDFISGEMWSSQYLWGYLFTAIAVFLMPLTLLAFERGRLAWAVAGAFTVSYLQPWQGATLALIVLAVELYRHRRPTLPLAAVSAAIAIPAVYYFLLSRLDAAWELAGEANARGADPTWHWPWWAIVLVLAPLAIPAALAYRLPARDWQEQAVRVWPFAALVVYLLPLGTFPYHSFQGLTIPLAILAVIGLRSRWRAPKPAHVALIVFLMVVPGIVHKVRVSAHSIRTSGDPFWVFPDEVRALKAIEADPREGGVLGAAYAGTMIPSRTGRETWVGALSWSPDYDDRVDRANDLVEGRLTDDQARALVLESGARFVFVDCRPRLVDLTAALRPIAEESRRLGCAQVHVVRPHPGMPDVGGTDE